MKNLSTSANSISNLYLVFCQTLHLVASIQWSSRAGGYVAGDEDLQGLELSGVLPGRRAKAGWSSRAIQGAQAGDATFPGVGEN